MSRQLISAGAFAAFLAVAFGAFGAHALKSHLADEMMTVYQTGVQYQMFHALALILIGIMAERRNGDRLVALSGRFMVIGIVLFCFTLYAYALTGRTVFALITPLGGLSFMAGWIALCTAFSRKPISTH